MYSQDVNIARVFPPTDFYFNKMVKLQLEMSKHITGFIHVQTNPYYSFDTEKTVKNAQSKLFDSMLEHSLIQSRSCGTFPASGQGL
jgi:transaldolase